MNFWQKMQKPIICMAPMADVTDSSFRHIIAKAQMAHQMQTQRLIVP
jgi:tRNA-dihydrouridine synthase